MTVPSKAVNYGIDAPAVVRNLVLIGAAGTALAAAAPLSASIVSWLPPTLMTVGVVVAVSFFGQFAYMIWSSKVGKLKQRDLMLDGAGLRGDERVLDVGCGRGLLLIGAAKRLPRGKAVGLDLWQAEDLSANSAAATAANARSEGVEARVEVVSGDMRKMPFADATFDVIVSSMTIHNVYTEDERRQALSEIWRVLKPGGRFFIQDFRHTDVYARVLAELGARDVDRSRGAFNVYGAQTVTGRK